MILFFSNISNSLKLSSSTLTETPVSTENVF